MRLQNQLKKARLETKRVNLQIRLDRGMREFVEEEQIIEGRKDNTKKFVMLVFLPLVLLLVACLLPDDRIFFNSQPIYFLLIS